MPLRLLSPGIEILSADGRFARTDGGAKSRRATVLLLARSCCAFEYRPDGEASPAAALTTARAHAAAASPFVGGEFLVRREGKGVAIWWWDRVRVAALLRERFGPSPPRLLPETLAQPRGDGWRIVRLDQGYEAQLWRDGVLIASAWRARPFGAEAWAAFGRVQREEGVPIEPPPALPLSISSAALNKALARQWTPREQAAAVLAACAFGMVLVGAFLIGQGLRLDRQTKLLESAAAAVAPVGPIASRDTARLETYRSLSARPDPVRVLAVAMGVAELYGAEPVSYAADTRQVILTLPYTAIGSLSRIAIELRDTGLFSEIRPSTDEEAGTIDLRLTLKDGVPLNPGE